jgi:hypothetical protein
MGHVEKKTNSTGKNTWQARWRNPAGSGRQATFAKKFDAERHLVRSRETSCAATMSTPPQGASASRTEQWRASQPHRATTAKAVEQHLRCYVYPVIGARGAVEHPTQRGPSLAPGRGEPSSSNSPALIGLQAHSGRVAFRHVRIKQL